MLNEISPKSPAAEGIRRIAELVTGRTPQVVEKVSPILSFLKGKKRA
jgi:Flp pilus assembly CpaE family ATPase